MNLGKEYADLSLKLAVKKMATDLRVSNSMDEARADVAAGRLLNEEEFFAGLHKHSKKNESAPNQ